MSSASLLLVEDDPVFRDVLTGALSGLGFQVTNYASLNQAESAINSIKADFAVLDLNLEGASCLPLIPLLRKSQPGIRILILTGYASIATAVQAIKLGANEYLTKPADADQISRALRGDQHSEQVETTVRESRLSARRLQWEHIQQILRDCDGNISEAARRLGMHRRTLQRKLQKRPVRY